MVKDSGSINVPKWFLAVVSMFLSAAVPWAYSITLQINTLSVKLERNLELEGKFETHKQDHVTQKQLDEIKRRLEKLEAFNIVNPGSKTVSLVDSTF